MTAEVVATGADWVELVAAGPPLQERPSPFPLTLATAVPKGDRFDWLIEKATELGVDRLIPILTERSVVDPGAAKLTRLRRSIIEASKQCGRNRLMVLESPTGFEKLIHSSVESTNFLADPMGTPANQMVPIPSSGTVVLAVGPEGGFTPRERDLALQARWAPICFSVNTLRIETAALAGCAILFSAMRESNE